MAAWGNDKTPSVELFTKVIEAHRESDGRSGNDPNYDFCMAITLSVLGEYDEARKHIRIARQAAREEIGRIFSPWNYRKVNSVEFLTHLEEAESRIGSDEFAPAYLSRGEEK